MGQHESKGLVRVEEDGCVGGRAGLTRGEGVAAWGVGREACEGRAGQSWPAHCQNRSWPSHEPEMARSENGSDASDASQHGPAHGRGGSSMSEQGDEQGDA